MGGVDAHTVEMSREDIAWRIKIYQMLRHGGCNRTFSHGFCVQRFVLCGGDTMSEIRRKSKDIRLFESRDWLYWMLISVRYVLGDKVPTLDKAKDFSISESYSVQRHKDIKRDIKRVQMSWRMSHIESQSNLLKLFARHVRHCLSRLD